MPKFYQPTPNEVKEARQSSRLTQAEAAELCMITSTTWARYEQGLSAMPAPIWKLFEYALAHKLAQEGVQGKKAAEVVDNSVLEEMLSTWKQDEIALEAKNYRYRDGREVI